MKTTNIIWEEHPATSYTAEQAVVNGHTVIVCLDDEGPLRSAFYWEVVGQTDGWENSVRRARSTAVGVALSLEAGVG